ncbi:MAG: hypothetical protein ACRCV4_03830 [Hafnia alvei]
MIIVCGLQLRGGGGGKLCQKTPKDRASSFLFKNVQKKRKKAMAQRGRKSLAATSAVSLPAIAESRLQPSIHLSDPEINVWIRLVNDNPASSFTETHRDMLEMYCRHVVQARLLTTQIEEFELEWLARDDGLKRYDKLLTMREREVRSASSLATRLRITRQATSDPKTVGRANNNLPREKKPWEIE